MDTLIAILVVGIVVVVGLAIAFDLRSGKDDDSEGEGR